MSGRGGEGEGHAVAEDGRARPDRPERAQPARVQCVQLLEPGIDPFGALDMHDRGHGRAEQRLFERIHRATDRDRAGALQRLERGDALKRHVAALGLGQHQRQRQIVLRLVHVVGRGAGLRRRGDEDREKAAAKPAGLRARQVDVSVGQARSHALGGDVAAQQAQHEVIVAVKDRGRGGGVGHAGRGSGLACARDDTGCRSHASGAPPRAGATGGVSRSDRRRPAPRAAAPRARRACSRRSSAARRCVR